MMKLQRTTLTHQAEHELLTWIRRERLPPGSPLPSIGDLAQQFGVSKVVVREALQSLSARGVLVLGNGKTARVRDLTSQPLIDFFEHVVSMDHSNLGEFVEVRVALERHSAALAARRSDEIDRKSLRSILTEMEQTLDDPDAFAASDLEFHLTVAKASGNTLLMQLIHSVRHMMQSMMREGIRVRNTHADRKKVHTLHEHIVQTIESGDSQAAEAAMTDHFDHIARSLKIE